MNAPVERPIEKLVRAHRQVEGGGFVVRRPVPKAGLPQVDPFLLIDEMGPVDYAPGEAVGAPDHPHRGFETVTYVLEGEVEHADSAGHRGRVGPGDVQWMTAGDGVVHAEMPSRRLREDGGRMHGFQIWVNLPARSKRTAPRYQEVPADRIPRAQGDEGRAEVRVIAGEAFGARASIDTHVPIVFHDWTLAVGADVVLPLPSAMNALVYVFRGEARVGDTKVEDGTMALLGAGDALRLRGGDVPGRLLLLAGVPLDEPLARHGPFVMNTPEELHEAFSDYRAGRLGTIRGAR